MKNLFNINLLLTRKCNQTCYYCDNYDKHSMYTEVDIDYLKWIISLYTKHVKLHIEFTGGEPGIVSNIEDVFEICLKDPKIEKISIVSNGLMRKRFNMKAIFKNKFERYVEHFCLEIRDKDILFFYPELPFYDVEDWIDYVLVLSDVTLESLLNNLDYYKRLYTQRIYWKVINFRKEYPTQTYFAKVRLFFNKLMKYNTNILTDLHKLDVMSTYTNMNVYITCAKIAFDRFIDLQNKQLGMCTVQVNCGTKFNITEENVKKSIDYKLFSVSDYCTQCYKINYNSFKFL